jgi:hypothetical protein
MRLCGANVHVRGQSEHDFCNAKCPLMTQSGHSGRERKVGTVPASPMRRPHIDTLVICSIEPPANNPTARENQRVSAVFIDDSQFQIATKGRVIYRFPHRVAGRLSRDAFNSGCLRRAETSLDGKPVVLAWKQIAVGACKRAFGGVWPDRCYVNEPHGCIALRTDWSVGRKLRPWA